MVADRTHLDDLSGDELDAIVLVEDAQFTQLLVHLDGERTREQRCHAHNIGSGKWPSQSHGVSIHFIINWARTISERRRMALRNAVHRA